MTTVRTETYQNIPEILETLENTTSMLEALSGLLEYAHRSGDELSRYSVGIERLIDQQCEDLRFLERAMREQYKELKLSKFEVFDLNMIAQWSGTSPKLAAAVIYVATGIRLPDATDETYCELVKNAQQVSILTAMHSKADLQAISRATAVPAEVVARVLDEAYLYNPRRSAATGKAQEKARDEGGAAHVGA